MLIYLSKKGHSVETENVTTKAMELLEQGYHFYENSGTEDNIELEKPVTVDDIKANPKKNYFAMFQMAGG